MNFEVCLISIGTLSCVSTEGSLALTLTLIFLTKVYTKALSDQAIVHLRVYRLNYEAP